jgi:hypothetical protein
MRRRRGIQLATAASIVVIITLGVSGPVSGDESPRNASRSDWLGAQGSTYWYVPPENRGVSMAAHGTAVARSLDR